MRRVRYGKIVVNYLPSLDGGGRDFGQDLVPIVKEHFRRVGRLCEFACGPGFLGFSMLAQGLCDSLCLVDVNPDAIEVCGRTIRDNRLTEVSTYVSDVFKGVPDHEKWDLVVSNPPHYDGTEETYRKNIKIIDPDFAIHREFYRNVSRYLERGGSTLLIESRPGSNPSIWKSLVEESGLEFNGIINPDPAILVRFQRRMSGLMDTFLEPAAGVDRAWTESIRRVVKHPYGYGLVSGYPYYVVWANKRSD